MEVFYSPGAALEKIAALEKEKALLENHLATAEDLLWRWVLKAPERINISEWVDGRGNYEAPLKEEIAKAGKVGRKPKKQ